MVISSSGISNNPILISTYGTGNKPIIGNHLSTWIKDKNFTDAIYLQHINFITIDGLHIIPPFKYNPNDSYKEGYGIRAYAVDHLTIQNCEIEGYGDAGTEYYGRWGVLIGDASTNVVIYNNNIHDLHDGINVYSSFVDIGYNTIHDLYSSANARKSEAIAVQGQYIYGGSIPFDANYRTVIHHNNIYGFGQHAIDCFLTKNIIIEYNDIHDPNNSSAPDGVSMGGMNRGIIVRYNKIHNFNSSDDNHIGDMSQWWYYEGMGIYTKGAKTAEIYGNLIYDVACGINAATEWQPDYYIGETEYDASGRIDVYNNTIIARYSGILTFAYAAPLYARNNIFYGSKGYDIETESFFLLWSRKYFCKRNN